MIKEVIVLGAGTAGLIAALSLKRQAPQLSVRIVRDPDLGVIGVGEGTTPNFPTHLFDYLGIKKKRFYKQAEPTWKLGIRFLWGPRGEFFYNFSNQLDNQWPGMKMPIGFYCEEEFLDIDLPSALMREGKAFARQPNRTPDVQNWHSFHVENHKLVSTLEEITVEAGVKITNGKMVGADRGPNGIEAIHLADGQRLEADFFIDASGFDSALLGKVLEEPFESFGRTLFCDSAVVGGWERTDEELLPYTTAETMDTGWCWRIEHEHFINRGYVYCSDMISDDEAVDEFRRKNPKVPDTPRLVRFRSGCHRRMWVDNVVAIGNSGGFVEPLEATAIMVICSHCKLLAEILKHSAHEPTDSMRDFYNEATLASWQEIRDFLGLHYKLNTADQTAFWRRCQEETDLSGIDGLLSFYYDNGPTGFLRHRMPTSLSEFGLEGYLVMLVGNKAPYRKLYEPSKKELRLLKERRSLHKSLAKKGVGVKEGLGFVKDNRWKWKGDH